MSYFHERPTTADWLRWGGLTVASGGLYLAFCAWVYSQQDRMVFDPVKTIHTPDQPSWDFVRSGVTLRGWRDGPESPTALMYLGGKGESVELRRPMLSQVFDQTTNYVVPYRGFGPNSGLRPGESVVKEDALALYDHLRERHDRVWVIGRSLGTAMAMHVAVERTIEKLVLVTPYDSLVRLAKQRHPWLPVPFLLTHRFQNWKDAPRLSSSVLTLLTEYDPITPHEVWHSLRDFLNTPVEEILWPRTTHESILEKSKAWHHMRSFLE